MSKYSALTPDGRRVLLEVGEYFDRDGVLRQCQPDPQALRIAQLKEEVAELKALCAKQQAKIHEADVDMLVSLAIDEGKVLPAQRKRQASGVLPPRAAASNNALMCNDMRAIRWA